MIEVLLLLALGVVLGRAWAWCKGSRPAECPRCAIDARTQQTLSEINMLRQVGEQQMREAAARPTQQAGQPQQPNAQRRYGMPPTDAENFGRWQ